MISVRPLRYRPPFFALLLGCLLAVGSACGISIDGDDDTTEIFKRVTVTQPLVAGQPITVTVEYEQPYAVQVEIACDLLRDESGPASQRRVVRGLQDRIPENPEGSTAEEATPTTGEVTREFVAPPVPGDYVMRCFTTADENNRVEVPVTVLPAAE